MQEALEQAKNRKKKLQVEKCTGLRTRREEAMGTRNMTTERRMAKMTLKWMTVLENLSSSSMDPIRLIASKKGASVDLLIIVEIVP